MIAPDSAANADKDAMTIRTDTESSRAEDARMPTYDARTLVAGGSTAEIRLDGQVYTLRITKAGKLILTK